MDLHLFKACLHFLFLSSVVFLIVSVIRLVRSSIHGRKLPKLPPGPPRLPIIGSLHHLVGALPYRRFRELSQKYGPLMYLQIGEVPSVVVSSAEVAKEILKTHDTIFSHRPYNIITEIVFYYPNNIASSPPGPRWRLLRKASSLNLLNAKRVASFQSLREKEVSRLITYLSEKARSSSSVNLSEELFATICSIFSKAAFGENYKAQEELLSCMKKIKNDLEDRSVSEFFPSQKWFLAITGRKGQVENLRRMVEMVLENILSGIGKVTKVAEGEADSLLSALLNLKENGDLTIDVVKALMLEIVIGSVGTSAAILEWAIAEMLKNPRIMKKAQAEVRQVFNSKGYINETSLEELKYLKAIIKETLRLYPVIPMLVPRECSQTCEINGDTIPSGTQVLVNAWAIARDPNHWSLPEEFFPERFLNISTDYKGFNFEYIPFGSGKRICPGMLFGVVVMEFLLAQLLCYFDWELPSGITAETLHMTETFGMIIRRKGHLILIPILTNPSPLDEEITD